jgi:metabolite-proton symporter
MVGRVDQAGLGRIVVASLVGTTIEFYDFYIYGTAAALVLGKAFFPSADASAQTLSAFLTFGIAFLARPIGAFFFGHFGDRVGRKATLVASMLVMGISTTLIGTLPTYESAGALAPWLLCLLRFGQGIGLGGEWGGAALLATEYAPEGKRGWFGMFPQLGPPLGFFIANGLFLALLLTLGEPAFIAWAWRVPFLVSAALVAVGLYVRATLEETPTFQKAMAAGQRESSPLRAMLSTSLVPLVQGSLAIVVSYALFYIATVFMLTYGTATLKIPRIDFLEYLCVAVLFMAAATPIAGALADRWGRKPVLLTASVAALALGFAMPALVNAGNGGVLAFLCLALGIMGLTFAPLGALLPELFPTPLRYTGAASAYNLGGILGASLAPYLAQILLDKGGIAYVGGYISLAALVSLVSLWTIAETRDRDMTSPVLQSSR